MRRLCGNELEASIRRIGMEVFQRADAAAPSAASIEFWQQKSMGWLTNDEDLKARLFHFVSVLPTLKNRSEVARQLQVDLAGASGLPPPLRLAISYSRPASIMAQAVAGLVQRSSEQMARQFICGATPAEAIASVEKLRRQGLTFTLDVLGETVHSDAVALEHQRTYINLFQSLGAVAPRWTYSAVLDTAPYGPLPRVNISIKLTSILASMDSMHGPAAVTQGLERLRPIMRVAQAGGAFLNIDMEHYAVKDLTLEIFRQALMEKEFRDWPDCGIVIQAYLKDARRDFAELIAWTKQRGTPISVRLVKGAYWDSETQHAESRGQSPPVFQQKWQSDVSFEIIAGMMLPNADIIRPAFGTHNVRSIAATLAMEQALGLPPRTVEIQMLTGMGNPLRRALVDMQQRVRIYSPFGDLLRGMAYLIRRLIENTANESFLRQTFDPSQNRAALLMAPGDPAELDEPAGNVQIPPIQSDASAVRHYRPQDALVH